MSQGNTMALKDFTGFKEFILRGNVIDLAVAVVLGGAFNAVVSALVKDLLTPLIAAIGGQPDFSSLYFTVNGSRFLYGDFVNSMISFLIMAAVVYFVVVVPMRRLTARPQAKAPSRRLCPECLSDIPAEARKCAHCTASVTPISPLRT
jgi:large conductance mechanosensitive channel